MKKTLIILTLFISTWGTSQNIYFIKSYGNSGYDFGRDIKQDLDTGYIATGSSSSFSSGTADAFLLKVDSLGNFKWSYNYGGAETDWGESVVVTHDSSYAIGGYTNSFGAGGFDFYLVRAGRDGTPLWEKTYGGSDWDRAHSMVQLADSGFVLVGDTYSYGNGNSDVFIVRTDKNGDTLWTRTYGGTENDYANAVLLDGDSLVVVGGTESFGAGMSDGLILKYHINGTLGWNKVVGKERIDFFTSITSNNLGEYFLGGSRHYYFDQTGYLADFWIYNMSDDGNTLLADTSLTGGSHEYEVVNDIVVDGNDNIFFGGETKSFGNAVQDLASDAFFGKLLNTYYQANFVDTYGAGGDDVINALDNCYDNGFVGIGDLTFNSIGGKNIHIIRVDKSNSLGGFNVIQDLINDNITLSFEDITNEIYISVYPTLFSDKLTITDLPAENQIQIYNNSGQLVLDKININSTLDLSFLSNGLYILKIQTEKGVATTKIIKE